MKIKKISLIFFLIFVLSFCFVDANYYWSQEANANYESTIAGNNYIAYGSNYVNEYNMSYTTGEAFGNYTQNGTNYTMCYITKSDYTPISADFNRDGILEVVVTDKGSDKLTIYTTKCEFVDEISVEQNIRAMPVLLDVDSECINEDDPENPIFELCAEFSPEIFVLTDSHLKGYTYNLVVGSFEESFSMNYTNEVYAPLDFLTCFRPEAPRCMAFSEDDAISFELTTQIINAVPVELLHTNYLYSSKYNGLTSIRSIVNPYEAYLPFSFYNYIDCGGTHRCPNYGNMLDEFGEFEFEYGTRNFGYELPAYTIYNSVFVARQGTLTRIFTSKYGYYGNERYHYLEVFDLSGNSLFFNRTYYVGSAKRIYSNWAVADINKDGSNDACVIDEENLKCYHPALGWNMELTYNYSGVMNDTYNFVLADFYSGYGWDELCIGSVEGIFCSGEKVYSTGILGDGYPITIFKDTFSNIPALVYTDDSQGFIVYADIDVNTCGNTFCEYWENQLSCPEDCEEEFEPPEEIAGEYSEGSPCSKDSDCKSGLKCLYGTCAKSGFNEWCGNNATCVSGSCINGKCTKPTLWQNVEASKNEQFGNDTPTNNFISLFFIIGISLAVGHYVNMWGGFISFFILAIFFTLVSWLSPFILIGMFIIGVIALVFGIMIGNTQG